MSEQLTLCSIQSTVIDQSTLLEGSVTSAKEVMFYPAFVYSSVCLSVCLSVNNFIYNLQIRSSSQNFTRAVSLDNEVAITSWKPSASGSESREFLTESSTWQDRAFFQLRVTAYRGVT